MKMHGDPLCPPPEFAGFKSATALLRDAIRRSPFGRAFSNQVGEAGGLVFGTFGAMDMATLGHGGVTP